MAIKKVVIPKTEVKWVCELSENEFTAPTEIMPDGVLHVSLNTIQRRLTKIETPKPLADDEVSVEDVNRYDILTFISASKEIFEIDKMFPYENYKALSVGQHYSTWSIEVTDNTNLKEVLMFLIQDQNHEIYCISGKNKQQEFFEWGLKQNYKLIFEYRYNFSNIQLFDLYRGITWSNLLKCFNLICCEDIKCFETGDGIFKSKIITNNYFEKIKVIAVLEYLFEHGEMPIGLNMECFEVL